MAELPQQTNPVGGQQGTARQISAPQQTTAISPNSKSDPATQQGQDQIGGKKSKKWIWIIVVITALIALGVGAWFLFFKSP